MIELPELILASGSPRRTEILTSVGWKFIKHPADIDETEHAGELPQDYVRRLAIEKAEVVAAEYPGSIVLGADTTVVIHGQIIGKPVDMADARRMLSMLAGNWHEVLTGVAICESGETRSAVDSTRVKFAPMTDSEVEFLATMGEPMDKAGAYAVQAQAALFIEAIDGDYWNVVGLPVKTVYDLVMKKPGN
ncbi:MAG: septum formation protein Maf [Chloracidobacterium sp.]|nr:septum formation protein Maf [Chloracidobacterium sp.]